MVTALGRGLAYPNDDLLAQLPTLLRAAGLTAVADQPRRYVYPLHTSTDADRVLASLYLPGLTQRRYWTARGYLRALARAWVSLPVPIRRIVAQPPASSGQP